MKAVIQCGGKGTRLRPHTSILPKPLMPIGARPVLELVLKWLRRSGISDVFITTGYLGHLIRSVCGDGSQWNMRITYTQEVEPLGTIDPVVLQRIPSGVPFGFDDLMFQMLDEEAPVNVFKHHGMWLDIGRVEDFLKAQDVAWDEQSPAFAATVAA